MNNDSRVIEPDSKRRIEALYYIYNRAIPNSKDQLSFQKEKQEFIAMFPEFTEGMDTEFDPDRLKAGREEIRGILRKLPRDQKIWHEEFTIRMHESLDLAFRALTRNMKEILGEELSLSLSDMDKATEAHEKLEKKLAALTGNMQSLPLAKRDEYGRAQMEVVFAWDIICMSPLVYDTSRDVIEIFCIMHQLGQAHGLLMNISKERVDILKDAYGRIKGSEYIVSRRWNLKKQQKDKACKIADDLWRKGDQSLHTEMADHLHESVKHPELNGLSRNQILTAIKQVAQKYNRVLGIKGVRKNK